MSDAWAEHEERRLGRGMFDDDGSDDVDARACDHDEDFEDVFDEDPLDSDDVVTRTREDPVCPEDHEINTAGFDVVARARVEPNQSWINDDVDENRFMSDIFKPGTNHVTDGLRGGGKTFQAVGFSEAMVEGAFKGMPQTVMLTNIIFVKRVSFEGDAEQQFIMETPPNVNHITSMEAMFRLQARLMREYGREGVMFLVVLDEAQNFLLADEYQKETSLAFVKWYGTTRKFNTCLWLLTPSINNLPPRARNFLDGDPAGYVNARWRKNKHLAAQYIRVHGIEGVNPQELTQLKLGTDIPPVWVRITSTPWTRPLEELDIGEYGYDHLANADFKVSIEKDRPFDFDGFLERCSDMPSYKMATVMQEFFDEMDGVSGGDVAVPEIDDRMEKASMIHRMRAIGLKWGEIQDILRIPMSTCQLWYSKYRKENGLDDQPEARFRSEESVPKGRHGRRTELFPKRVFSDPENPGKQPENGVSDDDGAPFFQGIARGKNTTQSTPLPRTPYLYNPTNGGNEGVSAGFTENDPRTVGGRLPSDRDPSGGSADDFSDFNDEDANVRTSAHDETDGSGDE